MEIATLWLAIWPPRSRSGWKAILKATASSADAVDARSCVAPWWLDSGWLSGQLDTCVGSILALAPIGPVRGHGLVHKRMRKGSLLLLDAARLYILDVH